MEICISMLHIIPRTSPFMYTAEYLLPSYIASCFYCFDCISADNYNLMLHCRYLWFKILVISVLCRQVVILGTYKEACGRDPINCCCYCYHCHHHNLYLCTLQDPGGLVFLANIRSLVERVFASVWEGAHLLNLMPRTKPWLLHLSLPLVYKIY